MLTPLMMSCENTSSNKGKETKADTEKRMIDEYWAKLVDHANKGDKSSFRSEWYSFNALGKAVTEGESILYHRDYKLRLDSLEKVCFRNQ